MDESAYQQSLPPGLELGQPLGETARFGRVFEVVDRRLSDAEPLIRVVRFLEGNRRESKWREPFMERARKLIAADIPHVSTPLDVGLNDEHVFVICQRYDRRLWDRLQTETELPVDEAVRLFRQILAGLAGLHARKIEHGDIRTKNIYLTESPCGCLDAWIADTVIGPMTKWTGGNLRDDDAVRYYPPEWNRQTRPPSYRADLFALGLVACEVFSGKAANAGKSASYAGDLTSQLKRSKAPSSVKRLVRALLAESPDGRPADAVEALQRLERYEVQQHWLIPVVMTAAAGLLIAAMLFASARSRGSQLADARAEASRLETELAKARQDHEAYEQDSTDQIGQLESENRGYQGRIEQLQREIEELKKRPGPQSTTKQTTERPEIPIAMQGKWLSTIDAADGDSTADTIAHLMGNSHKIHADLLKYLKPIQQLANQPFFSAWLDADKRLAELVQVCLKTPWDGAAFDAALARHADLESAKEIWKEWARSDSGMTWQNVRGAVDSNTDFSDGVREILRQWCAAIEAHPAKGWVVRLKSGRCDEGFGVLRIVWVYGTRTVWREYEWSSETSHDYATSGDSRDIRFEWKPGDRFGIMLERDDWVNTDIVATHWDSNALKGPLAVWAANQMGRTASDKGALTFEILDCPGPPPAVYKKKVPARPDDVLTQE